MWLLLVAATVLVDEALWAEAARASDPQGAWRDRAALVPWPLLDPETDADLAVHLDAFSPASRRAWAADRLLPVVAGEIAAPDEWVTVLVHEVVPEAQSNGSFSSLRTARRAYADGRLDEAAAAYGAIPVRSSAWAAALRERAWTDLRRDAFDRALGATVSLRAPFFGAEDQAEASLLSASVLVTKCRYDEARRLVEGLATWREEEPAEADSQRIVAEGKPREGSSGTAWEAPLVRRGRAAMALAVDAPEPMRTRLQATTARLYLEAWREAWTARRSLAARAVALLYDAARAERKRLEASRDNGRLTAGSRPGLEDGEIAWPFTGSYWRDELGTYRWRAADACGPESPP